VDRDDRVVVVTGDHGEQFPSSIVGRATTWGVRKVHLRVRRAGRLPAVDRWMAARTLGHGHHIYDHLVRVPLVIAGPGIPRSCATDQVRHVDVTPTIVSVCGASPPRRSDGRDLSPLWIGSSLPEEPAFMEAGEVAYSGINPIIGLRTPDWKLVRDRDRTSLFSMKGVPPDESHDLSSAHPDVADRLNRTLDELTATSVAGSGMTDQEEAIVERHLQDLGYL
jgi:arylsulfatase A-like enzyme